MNKLTTKLVSFGYKYIENCGIYNLFLMDLALLLLYLFG